MVRVRIGTEDRDLREIDESWINQQVNRRRNDGVAVCVRVTINDGMVNMALSTADCPDVGGGDRPPNTRERQIFQLWEKLGLDRPNFHGGNLVAFLKQLRH